MVPSTHPPLWETVSGVKEGICLMELLLHEKTTETVRGFGCTEETGAGCSSQCCWAEIVNNNSGSNNNNK